MTMSGCVNWYSSSEGSWGGPRSTLCRQHPGLQMSHADTHITPRNVLLLIDWSLGDCDERET